MLTIPSIGRFEIRDFLGRGAISDVYLAWDPKIASEVALKLIRTDRTDPDMVAAERNGTALQAALCQVAPQVPSVYEWGDQDGYFWVAMEYIGGANLATLIEREAPFSEERAANIALRLCDMLETFHEFSAGIDGRKGIVHGDLKPENIQIQYLDEVRVLDFGIAKHLSQTRRFTVNLFGSLPYTPPERLNSGRLDVQSDLWGVGVILYLMVAGYPPWSGQDPEELETRLRRGDPPVPLPDGCCSVGMKEILYRALAFEPEKRYPSAAAFRAALLRGTGSVFDVDVIPVKPLEDTPFNAAPGPVADSLDEKPETHHFGASPRTHFRFRQAAQLSFLRRLDELSWVYAGGLGVAAGGLAGIFLFTLTPMMKFVGFLLILGVAAWAAITGEPVLMEQDVPEMEPWADATDLDLPPE